jgi:hypothetical protein
MSVAHTWRPFNSAMRKPKRTNDMLTMLEKMDSFEGVV